MVGVADLEAEAGDPVITRALAGAAGCLLVAKPQGGPAKTWAPALGQAAKETGEALAALGTALATDGTITAQESRETGLRREVAEAMAMLAQLDLQLEALEAGE